MVTPLLDELGAEGYRSVRVALAATIRAIAEVGEAAEGKPPAPLTPLHEWAAPYGAVQARSGLPRDAFRKAVATLMAFGHLWWDLDHRIGISTPESDPRVIAAMSAGALRLMTFWVVSQDRAGAH